MPQRQIHVIVVDDSHYIRELFTEILSKDPYITVVASASDPYDAREKIKTYNPDVITLDIEMPKMDGIAFLEKIVALRPMPVVMVSSLTQKGADITLRALDIGAVDCIGKPGDMHDLGQFEQELIAKVKAAAQANVRARSVDHSNSAANPNKATVLSYNGDASKWLIAIGASTGGVEALRDVLVNIPPNAPPIVITQHMPAMFTAAFAQRLDKICAITVLEAKNDLPIRPGHAYIANGGQHFLVQKTAGRFVCKLEDGDLVSGHKPSVDVLFNSVAEHATKQAVGCILTGMGKDGAQGLLAIRNAGAHTIGENETSCVVYGMPRAAFELGAVEKQCHLRDISRELLKLCN